MTVMEAIQNRFSVRSYLQKSVEPDKLQRLLEAARLAPSAGNRQEWRFVVVATEATREALMHAAREQRFVGEAPVVIVACAEHVEHVMPCGQLSYPIDVAIALEHIALQAVEEGLGTCWIGAFDEARVKEILGIPDEVRVVELITVGYPAVAPGPKNRMAMKEIVMYERWGK
ncbi:MAG: nitroreductase family protein [Armatimonadota bacterium]|jgi:nitroreductase